MKLKPVALIDIRIESQNKGIKESTKDILVYCLWFLLFKQYFHQFKFIWLIIWMLFHLPNLTGLVISIEQILLAIGTIAPIVFLKKYP